MDYEDFLTFSKLFEEGFKTKLKSEKFSGYGVI